MRRLQFTPAAIEDLDSIWAYTVEQWGKAQAVRYVRDLQATCKALAEGRQSGRSAEDIRTGYLKAACGAHILFYRVTAEALVVVRILHQRMDVEHHL